MHFVLIGAVLFGLDYALTPTEATSATEAPGAQSCPLPIPSEPIVVDQALRDRLAREWSSTHAAPPDAAQLEGQVQHYIDQHVLYREGLARGLAEGDARIRERVTAQMAYVLDSGLVIEPPEEATLRAWFEARADRYARPERVDFTQVFVQGRDAGAEARARELLGLLDAGADPNGLGDRFSGGRRFRGRKLDDLSARFGEAFIAGLQTQAQGTWALRRSDEGLHLVRVDRWVAGRAPEFEVVREQVHHDWEEAQRIVAREEATQAMRGRWEIVISP